MYFHVNDNEKQIYLFDSTVSAQQKVYDVLQLKGYCTLDRVIQRSIDRVWNAYEYTNIETSLS